MAYSLFCAIYGQKTTFRVKVNETQTVDELKDAIKAKAETAGHAHTLTLYKVNIDISKKEIYAEVTQKIKQCSIEVDKEELVPAYELSEYWKQSNLPKNTIHILIQLPRVTTPPNKSPVIPFTPRPDKDVERGVKIFITTLRKKFKSFFENDVQLPLWKLPSEVAKYLTQETRSHITGLKIPAISSSSKIPSLLLHNLGESFHDAELDDRINTLFDPEEKIKFLCNTSGSGKTRLLFEGLSRNWGFYFTARTEPDGIGSSDLEKVQQDLKLQLKAIIDGNRDTLLENQHVALRRSRLLLFARCVCFRVFLQCAETMTGKITENHKLRWLLIQLAPRTLLRGHGRDIFLRCTQVAGAASAEYLEQAIDRETLLIDELIEKYLPEGSTLFCVLDEAQALTKEKAYFQSDPRRDESPEPRPILPEILSSWSLILPLIVSGTGISMTDVHGPVVAKERSGPSKPMTEVGGFDDEGGRRAYLRQYFPPGTLDTSEGEEIVSLVRYWLRGRHRFIATYLSRLIRSGFLSPHRVLNEFVSGMTKYRPSDWDDHDDGTTPPVELEPPLGFDFNSLSRLITADRKVLTDLVDFVFEYTFTGEIRGLSGDLAADMVEYGISRFKKKQETLVAETDEPLAILALVTFLEQNERTLLEYLKRDLNASNDAFRGIEFEQYVTFVLLSEFSGPKRLSEVFSFVEGNKKHEALQHKRAELVALNKVGDNFQITPVRFKSRSRPSHILGYSPSTFEGTYEWFQDPHGVALCFPANTVGPDLIFVLRLPDDNTVLRVAVQFKHTKDMKKKDWRKALSTTEPSTWLSKKTQGSTSFTCSNTSNRDKLKEAIKHLGNGTKQAGPCGLLRVVCSHPSVPDSDELEKAAKGEHPLATVALHLLDQKASDLGKVRKSLYEQARHGLHNRDLKRKKKRKRSDENMRVSSKRQRRGADTGIGGSM